jgi:hypothetical protein
MEALSRIPDIRAGDSVWWHCDMIHSVAPVENQQGSGNVIYIPAAWLSGLLRDAEGARLVLSRGHARWIGIGWA